MTHRVQANSPWVVGQYAGLRHPVVVAVREALRASATLTPCTVTGSGDIAVSIYGPVIHVTVDVTQPAGSPPTGTVTFQQDVQEPYTLHSSSITGVFCHAANDVSISGTLLEGGDFTLLITPNPVQNGQWAALGTPFYATAGPVVDGGFTITPMPFGG
jgi:hypothetical protein